MIGFVRRWLDRRRCKKMGSKALSVGTRMDGSIDVDIAKEDDEESGWNLSNLELQEAEFLHEELGRAIARQKGRGFPKPPPPEKLPELPAAPVSPSSLSTPSET
jgi:hypothetical protein